MQGIRVPHDVSVVGFDDIDLAEHFVPPLTTIRQPRDEIGRRAAKALIALLGGGKSGGMETLPVELAVRRSTGPARV